MFSCLIHLLGSPVNAAPLTCVCINANEPKASVSSYAVLGYSFTISVLKGIYGHFLIVLVLRVFTTTRY